ncbi:MAG TPA: ABC transporter ATP-binding protein [Herpetosiphon sp.]|uniref:ABC transporter related n=1 Tax=Herpetosiphon aurantiacus (strain ATCC 23779 / DSM 785 / 114-95) TaxID=316274 RepID=A9B1U4_HERA2|nr:ABC transporter ATP-binding protein [Herpetosiphon sp.]ABX05386.1 ABC transporter related [Herpetosiphon aurantiacus DSM 785]HBW48973.1 ABC transporter ATP-binding protein [Herpetosiphon sp.]
MAKREFSVAHEYNYPRSSSIRWIIAHVWRYWFLACVVLLCFLGSWVTYSQARVVIGAVAAMLEVPFDAAELLRLSLIILALLVGDGFCLWFGSLAGETIAARFEADAREELYISLLGKSQAYHDRQRVGDLMARATDDTSQLASMIVPGSTMIFESILGIVVPLTYIGFIKLELLLVPLGFVACYIIAVRRYVRRLNPVVAEQREQFGKLNAGLEETISGIEVVKASAREGFERLKYRRHARGFRDLFVQQGRIEACYIPLLLFGITFGLTFLHTMILFDQNRISIADIIAVMSLIGLLRFPTFISLFAFTLVQTGIASAGRILGVIKEETELDENTQGHQAAIKGELRFENVQFGYEAQPILHDVSFSVKPGQTVAIVGQTGSGKSALTQLVNRTYDVQSGRVLIDGIDVREWNLDTLRSQISKIEQDVFLFSRTIGENIAFGAPSASREQIIEAAKAAQAHDFISSFVNGYDTEIGERGVTLSGGQRQRIALARAFLSNPRILILDDSTSAIDSATEDQIQRAIREAQRGRTTLLITHRLSQIRWADVILVLDGGRIVAAGSHEQLLRSSSHYRRIFARYESSLPPIEAAVLD